MNSIAEIMRKIKNSSRTHTIAFCLCIFFFSVLSRFVAGITYALLPETIATSYFMEIMDMIIPIALVILCGYGFILGMKGFGQTFKVGLPLFLFYFIILLGTIWRAAVNPDTQLHETPTIILGIISMFGVGIREEMLFRGLIGNALILKHAKDNKGMCYAVFIAAFLFGAVHFSNVFAGVTIPAVITQIITAALLGAIFVAIYLRGGNIWVPVLIHAVIDALGLFESAFVVSSVSEVDLINTGSLRSLIIRVIIMLSFTLFLLRKSKRPEIFARLEKLREEQGF